MELTVTVQLVVNPFASALTLSMVSPILIPVEKLKIGGVVAGLVVVLDVPLLPVEPDEPVAPLLPVELLVD